MTRIDPNPHSPYADADPNARHIFPTLVFYDAPAPGTLALAGCERLAVVPAEQLRSATDGALPDGLCPACVAAMRGEELPADVRPVSQCGECGSFTDHDGLCALCRQDAHAQWWAEQAAARTAEETAPADEETHVVADNSDDPEHVDDCPGCTPDAVGRVLTPDEYSAAWHAVEGAAGEPGADPGTVLLAVLGRLGIQPPTA